MSTEPVSDRKNVVGWANIAAASKAQTSTALQPHKS